MPAWIPALYVGASALSFVLYGADKSAAVHGRERIPESMLIGLGYVGGWPGALAAQQVFRHKTAKLSFRIRLWISVIVNVTVLLAWALGEWHAWMR